jgi:hypothetical protein
MSFTIERYFDRIAYYIGVFSILSLREQFAPALNK